MAQLETWLRQDLKQPIKVQYLGGNLFSQDNQANLIGVEVFDDGVAATLGGSVSASVIRADGGTVAVPSGTVSGNKASVVLPQAAYAVPGQVSIVVKLTQSGTVTTLAALIAVVYRSSTDTVIDPGTILPSVETLIAQVNTAVASIPADYSNLWATIAPAFSNSTAYTAGQYVTYNGHLYRFTADHGAGTFVSTDCTQVDVGGELSSLKSAINVLEPVATSSDVGKALIVKTVENNKASEYEFGETGEGWTPAMKSALLQCFQHVEWDDEHGQDYYDELYNALYPPTSITATYDSTHVAKTSDSLDSLKPYLLVKAHYNGAPDETITSYTLSGELNVGDNTITISFVGLTTTVTVTAISDSDAVDICLFAGQSNMDGRGDSSDAPTVTQGTAFKWDATNNTVVNFEAEGSLIPAFVKTYYEETGVPIVEVKEAEGGINISQWMSNHMTAALTKISNCISYLESQNKTVRNVFMVWNQGENDVYDGTTTAQYETLFGQMKTTVMAGGIEDIFIINIGQVSVGNYDFSDIRTALEEVCNGTDVVMVSDKFYNAKQYMKDQWHYNQIVYNAVGENAASNTVSFLSTGEEPNCIPFDASDVYGVPEDYMDISTCGWTYVIVGIKCILTACTVETTTVKLYGKLNDMYYLMRLAYPVSSSGALEGNTVTKNVTIASGVAFAAQTTGVDGEYGTKFAKGATALESISGIPSMTTNSKQAFYGTSSLAQSIDITNIRKIEETFRNSGVTAITGTGTEVTSLQNTFRGCTGLVSVCDLDGAYTRADGAFRDDTNLETVGVIKGTSLTNIDQIFYGCTKLEGVVKFLSSGITKAQYAFYNCDLTKIEIQVPANSTTYTTLTTAYPNANVTTF